MAVVAGDAGRCCLDLADCTVTLHLYYKLAVCYFTSSSTVTVLLTSIQLLLCHKLLV